MSVAGSTTLGSPVAPSRGRLRPLGLAEVRITGGFWAERQRVNREATLGHALAWMERLGWVGNHRAAAEGRLPRDRGGREFSDSEVYKLSEALAWESSGDGARGLGAPLDDLVGDIAAAQEPDGYLNTAFGRPGQPARYSSLEWGHELYCYGFLIQAGVAQARSRGDGALLEIARRAADHVCETFGRSGRDGVCGHPAIEMALVELARQTGEERYLDQAALFVDRRGHGLLATGELGSAYFQDDVPVRDATVLRGHAVRALYLASGAADVAIERGDDGLLEAVIRQWGSTVGRRTYLTGGMGSRHFGESFGEDFELPPDRAYSETCAGVASIQLAWRLLLATGDPKYADLVERTLYNVVATSPAADGRSFFYANTLHQRRRDMFLGDDVASPWPSRGLRAAWYDVSCCPTNVARTLASLSTYLATSTESGLQIHQFADADISTVLAAGRPLAVRLHTGYPATGTVTVELTEAPSHPVTIALRVPGWARGRAVVTEPGGQPQPAMGTTAEVTRVFAAGDQIRLDLPVEPRWTYADPRVDAVRGMVAVERGPVVYCAESPDLADGLDVDAIRVDPGSHQADDGGAIVAEGWLVDTERAPWPYGSRAVEKHREAPIRLIPYHSWAQRGPSTMRVWLPT